MASLRKAGKKDLNQAAIVAALRAIGCSVQILNQGGVPDLLVGFRGVNYLLEVKSARGRLTSSQQPFLSLWRGHVAVVRSLTDALMAIGHPDRPMITKLRRTDG
jgi:hypothetical protein